MLFAHLLLLVLPSAIVALLTMLSPVLQTYLTSGIMWVANKGAGWLSTTSVTVKRLILGVIGIVVAYAFSLLHVAISADPMTWGTSTVQGLLQALAASLIYDLGKSK